MDTYHMPIQDYVTLRRQALQDDLDNTDSSQPEERKYLKNELLRIKKSQSNYFKDPW